MKQSYKLTLAGAFLAGVAAVSHAEDKQKLIPPSVPAHMPSMGMHHGMGMGMMGGGMGGMMANMTEEQKDQHFRSMQEHMLAMHDLSNQILAEKDLAKKEKLKNQQLQLMKAHHAQMMQHHQAMPAAPVPAAK